MTDATDDAAIAEIAQIASQYKAARQYFANHETRADEIKDRLHVETIGKLLGTIHTLLSRDKEMRARIASLERDLAEADEAIFRTPKGHTSASLEQLAGLWKCPVEFARHHVRVDQENDALKARLSQIEAETIERCYQAVWDAGGDNVEFHCAAIRSLSPSQGKP